MFKKAVAITGISFLLGCALVLGTAVSAYCQCVAAPFLEDFEGGASGWVAGGTSSTWAFGTPAKTAINSAGSGTKPGLLEVFQVYTLIVKILMSVPLVMI
ncbi:MAG: hypothetical protein PHC51_10680 [bacterium]|nr:hypothetical protein [bacterium]